MSEASDMALVRTIDEEGVGLTGWEIEFIDSLLKNPDRPLTERQREVLDRIYEERCS